MSVAGPDPMPFASKSARPRSFQADSCFFCCAWAIPNAATRTVSPRSTDRQTDTMGKQAKLTVLVGDYIIFVLGVDWLVVRWDVYI